MKLCLYSMRDLKGGFTPPNADVNDATALRNFAFAVNNSDSVMNFQPQDFQLFKVGEFDSEIGIVFSIDPPVLIADGNSVYGGNYSA